MDPSLSRLKRYTLSLTMALSCASAQMLTNPVQDYINKTTLLNNILSNMRANQMIQQSQTGGKNAAPANPPASKVDATAFRHAGAALIPKQLASRAQQPQQAEQYLATLIALYEATAKKDGFPAHDLAYALNYFVVNTYMTYHNLHDVEYSKDPRVKKGKDMFERLTLSNEKKLLKVTPYQERAVYNQLKSVLAANPKIRELTDQQKQEVTELLAITFGVNFRAYMEAVNREDERAIDAARRQAKENLEKLTGCAVERIRIDESGLAM
jgi:hypothetical protein